MQGVEYKVVAAPRRAKPVRGARGKAEAMARALEDILQEEAAAGWEYVRADLIPCEEKPGFFARRIELHRAMLVFRKLPPAAPAPRPLEQPAERAEPVRSDHVRVEHARTDRMRDDQEPYPLRSPREPGREPAREPERAFAEPAAVPFRPLGSATD